MPLIPFNLYAAEFELADLVRVYGYELTYTLDDPDNAAAVGDTFSGPGGNTYTITAHNEIGFVARYESMDLTGTLATSFQFFVYQSAPQPEFDSLVTVTTSGGFVFCFLPGTRIATPGGTVEVQDLKIGDEVQAEDGRAVPVTWIGRQTCATLFVPEARRPVAIAPGAVGEGLPARELRVTADHALLLDGVLVQAGALVNGTTIRHMTAAELGWNFTVFHVETADHEIILAEGCPAETFVDNVTRARFDNFAEWQALHGTETRTMRELDLPRAMSPRQVPPALRARIAACAAALLASADAA